MDPQAQISLELHANTSHVSLSGKDLEPLKLAVTARITSSSEPSRSVTLLVNKTPLDGGFNNHVTCPNGLFWGAFNMESVDAAGRTLDLTGPGTPHPGSKWPLDMKKDSRFDLYTVPTSAKGEGFVATYELPLEILFRQETFALPLKHKDVKVGERFKITMRNLDRCDWWAFGDLNGDLKRKKLWHGHEDEYPQDDSHPGKVYIGDGGDLMVGGSSAGVHTLSLSEAKREGWIFSNRTQNLQLIPKVGEDSVMIEFTE